MERLTFLENMNSCRWDVLLTIHPIYIFGFKSGQNNKINVVILLIGKYRKVD